MDTMDAYNTAYTTAHYRQDIRLYGLRVSSYVHDNHVKWLTQLMQEDRTRVYVDQHLFDVMQNFMKKELLREGEPASIFRRLEYLACSYPVRMFPLTLDAYPASPLEAVAQGGAVESLEMMMRFLAMGSFPGKAVVKAAMRDVIAAKMASFEASLKMTEMLLDLNAYGALDCAYTIRDHLACFAVSEGRMDIVQLMCEYDEDTKLVPMAEFVTKQGLAQPCQCDLPTCNVSAVVKLHQMGFHVDGLYTSPHVEEGLCKEGRELLQAELPAQLDTISDSDYCDGEQSAPKKRKL